MECKVQVLAPIVVNGAIVISGEATLPEVEADEHDKAGRVAIITRDGKPEMWAGCCDGRVRGPIPHDTATLTPNN